MTSRSIFGPTAEFLPYLRPYRWRLGALIVCLLGVATLEGVGIGLLFPLVDYVQLGNSFATSGRSAKLAFHALGVIGLTPSVPVLIALVFLVILSTLALKFCVTRASAWIHAPMSEDVREAAFRKIANAHLFYFYDHSSGALITAIDTEVESLATAFHFSVILLTAGLSVMIYVAFVLVISWKLTFLMAAIGLMRYLVAGLFFRRLRSASADLARLRDRLKTYLVGIHQGIEVIKSYGTTNLEVNRFGSLSAALLSNAKMTARLTARTQYFDGLLGEGLLCILVFLAVSRIGLTGTPLLTFLVIATRIIPKISGMNEARVRITEQFPRISLLPGILSERLIPKLPWGQIDKRGFESKIAVKDVSFSYPSGRVPSLEHIDLEIERGKTIAIVGESGSGKSTLARLLLRLFDPTSGSIEVDDTPLRQLSQEAWTRLITVVSQDTFIFDDTVAANVRYGSEGANNEQVWEALQRARADQFVSGLSDGLQTRLGERGIRLSGGQRQRIAIARAFLRDCPILVLDEATSAMDAITERHVHDAVLDLAKDRTVIIIAHRFTTIKQADRIIVLEGGRIVESGSHEELVRLSGRYQKLLALQS